MSQYFALLDLRQAFVDFADEPLVVIDEALDGLPGQSFGVTALLSGQESESGLQFGMEVYFHALSVEVRAVHVKRGCTGAAEPMLVNFR